MLAIDRLKRLTSGVKHLSLVDGRTASLELLEPPPPAPPITGRWSDGEATAIPLHVYDGAMAGVQPKKSPSGDSISTTGSGTSGSSAGSGAQSCTGSNTGPGSDVKVISKPIEDVGLAGAIPYRHSSTSSSNLQPDIITVQVRKNVRSCTSDDKKESTNGQQLMYHSFQGSPGKVSDNEMFLENYGSGSFEAHGSGYSITGAGVDDRHKHVAKSKSETENSDKDVHGERSKIGTNVYAQKYGLNNNINNNSNLSVDTGEHIYDTPQISQSPKSAKPSVMPKPSSSILGMAGPLHVSTPSDPSFAEQTNLSPGGKSGKKVPPPPPVRTHSIRTDTVTERTPGSPVKTPVAPAIVTSSPVHQHPTNVITPKQHPPPVMQKPQKPIPATSQPHIQYDEHSLPQQHSLSPLISQKSKSPNPLSQKVIILPTNSPHLHSPTPGPGSQQMPVFGKPQNTPHQHLQPKSPLLNKAPLAAMVTSVPKQQQQLPHHQPLPQPTHKAHPAAISQPLGISQQPRTAASPAHHFVHTSSLPGHSEEPQVKAFANCVKSLSEKFGKNTHEDDQFPDNVSTDSDDFPPPPPPIAMDIITPKIHNYGIPSSRDRRKPEFGLQHHRDYTHKSRASTAGTLSCSPIKGVHPELTQKNLNQRHHSHPSVVIAATKILPEHLAAVQLRKQPPISSPSSHSSSGTEHEHTPESDSMNAISKEKRSESTSSFESNSSSSSIDSNTLPFANENVGTIKQRIVTVKPVGGKPVDKENGQRALDQNSDIFDRGLHRHAAGHSDSYCSSASPCLHSRHRSSSMSESTNSSGYTSDVHHHQRTHQRQLSNPSFSGRQLISQCWEMSAQGYYFVGN